MVCRDAPAQLAERLRRQLRGERHLVQIDHRLAVHTEIPGTVLRLAQHVARLPCERVDIVVELGQFAAQSDLELFFGGHWQNDFFERLTADVRPAPPGHEKRVDAGRFRQPDVPADDLGIVAVVAADQRVGFRATFRGPIDRPHARRTAGTIPGVVNRPYCRLPLGSIKRLHGDEQQGREQDQSFHSVLSSRTASRAW